MSHIMDHFLSSSNLLLKYTEDVLGISFGLCMHHACLSITIIITYIYTWRPRNWSSSSKLATSHVRVHCRAMAPLAVGHSTSWWGKQVNSLPKEICPAIQTPVHKKSLSYTQREINVQCHATKLQYGHVIIKAQWHNVRHVLSTSCSHPWRREPRWASLVPPMRLVASIATFIVFLLITPAFTVSPPRINSISFYIFWMWDTNFTVRSELLSAAGLPV